MKAPIFGYTKTDEDPLIILDPTLDGKPFPWLTVDDWTVRFTEEGVATLTVTIPVSLPPDLNVPPWAVPTG